MESAQQEGTLALDEDESLPWLESDEYEEEGGLDTSQIIGFALVLFVLAALIIGAVWFWNKRGGSDDLVADGSTIEAPEGPYKERPEDPGGKQFAGTGDVAPKVGEGVGGESKLGTRSGDDAPRPSVNTVSTADGASPKTAPVKPVKETSPEPSGVGVQVGAYSNKSSAETGWNTLRGQTTALNGVSHRVIKGQADIGTVYRLQAVASDIAAAQELCKALKADGVACQVKR